ncbi:MAG: rhomboid family intramembrane serine protease, partial [Tumebacillaceae bacterium]
AQSLIVHDDFIILPHKSEDGQEIISQVEGVGPLFLFRKRWNTIQIVRLQLADNMHLEQIERMMDVEVERLGELKRVNGVQNMYTCTLFIFSQWRSDENMRAISELSRYGGLAKSTGAAALAIDLARGVNGPLPTGAVAKSINWEALLSPVPSYGKEPLPEHVQTRTAAEWRAAMEELSQRHDQEVRQALRPEQKTVGVYTIIAINVLVWLLVQMSPDQILSAGVLIAEQIRAGEYWRLMTAVFLHYQASHIGFNMVTLYSFGSIAERIFGTTRFWFVYLLAGLSGSLLSFALNDNPSLGASGAIFGLFGALVAFGQLNRRVFSKTIGPSVYGLLIINLVLGFVMPQVDYWAHIGGLIGGYLSAHAIGISGYRQTKRRWLYLLGYVLLVAITFVIGQQAS